LLQSICSEGYPEIDVVELDEERNFIICAEEVIYSGCRDHDFARRSTSDFRLGSRKTGSTSSYPTPPSFAELPLVIDYLHEMLEGGIAKVVVFAHHRDVTCHLREGLGQHHPVILIGGMGPENDRPVSMRFKVMVTYVFLSERFRPLESESLWPWCVSS
jgi:hypothetical protein